MSVFNISQLFFQKKSPLPARMKKWTFHGELRSMETMTCIRMLLSPTLIWIPSLPPLVYLHSMSLISTRSRRPFAGWTVTPVTHRSCLCSGWTGWSVARVISEAYSLGFSSQLKVEENTKKQEPHTLDQKSVYKYKRNYYLDIAARLWLKYGELYQYGVQQSDCLCSIQMHDEFIVAGWFTAHI